MPKCSGSSRAGTRCLKPISLCSKGEGVTVLLKQTETGTLRGVPMLMLKVTQVLDGLLYVQHSENAQRRVYTVT